MKKIKEWSWRYLPAEFFAILSTFFSAWIVFSITDNHILAAYSGVIGENIGFYGFIFFRDIWVYKKEGKIIRLFENLKIIRNIIVEFSFAEIMDSFLVRPFCLYWFPIFLQNFPAGIIIGKIVADVIFYIPTIITYELSKEYIKK